MGHAMLTCGRGGRQDRRAEGHPVREIRTPEGRLILGEPALATIAGHAALLCPGVEATMPGRLPEELARWLLEPPAPREQRELGTADIELDDDHCRVGLHIVVTYGASIAGVCRAVAHAVAEALRIQAGVVPDQVEVRVVGVRQAQPSGPRASEGSS